MDVPISYMFAHPEYYEPLDRVEGGRDYKELAEAGMPAGWEIHRSGLWYQASHPACEMPEQGFKIHVSSKPSTAADLLMRVVPICCGAMTSFKFVANDTLLRFTVSKRWARGASGKFITIYPRSQAIFHELLDRLQAETGELQGPYVLSDKRYGDRGVLYYRYGGFRAVRRLNPDGTTTPEIRTPSGSLMEDYRLPEFRLPNWVRDPCADESEAQSDGPVVLADRFEVESAIQFSNSGGVYRANDRSTGMSVILKEARPCTNCWTGGGREIDATDLLRREFSLLTQLADTGVTPAPIALFSEWEHLYLAEEFVPGQLLAHVRASETYALALKLHDRRRSEDTLPAFKWLFCLIARQLLRAIGECHTRSIILGDLSPRNVIVDVTGKSVRLVDVESAVWPHDPLEGLRQCGEPPALSRLSGDKREHWLRETITSRSRCFYIASCCLSRVCSN